MTSQPARVVLVEDNDIFRETLELLLALRSEVQVVGSVASGDEAVELCARLEPDVVLVDYRMPGHERRRDDPGRAARRPADERRSA